MNIVDVYSYNDNDNIVIYEKDHINPVFYTLIGQLLKKVSK